MGGGTMSVVFGVFHVFWSLILVVYYALESAVTFLVPWSYWVKDVSSETVLITGAGSGIGRELALLFSKLCSKLVLLDIDAAGLAHTAELVRKDGAASVHTYSCDVANAEQVFKTAIIIRQEVGLVTMLINNAGIVSGCKLLQLSEKSIRKTMDVNTLAHFWMCQAFLPDMIRAKHGHIVSIASLAGYFFPPKLSDYCASKAAALAFTECLRADLESEGHDYIKLTLVAPYHVTTQLFQGFKGLIGGFSPEWVAKEIVSGVLSDQEFITVPKFFAAFLPILAVLPRKSQKEIHKYTGFMTCMDSFIGKRDLKTEEKK